MKTPDIHRATAETYDLFNKIRHLAVEDFPPGMRYWNIVVLTASDEDQRSAYEIQIKEKLVRKEIPRGVEYHVFADPPGPKIGCGGATMEAIIKLRAIYGSEELDKKFVLLINAGGQSQRLPSASVLGKIFSALPIGERGDAENLNTNWQLLELKLACYIPLLHRMKPGFMHVASDTIEVFDLGEDTGPDNETSWNFEQPGMTALAHPSSLDIGRTHGVFVLEQRKLHSPQVLSELRSCQEVLQKPSLDEMRHKGAVIKNTEVNEKEESAASLNEFVYTDSAFYFDHAFASRLVSFYEDVAPLGCEIDAYGDFMRSLGPKADGKFTTDTRNVSTSSAVELAHLVEMKKKLFDYLRGCPPLNIVVMNASKFYHLGTMKEYVENLCEDEELAGYLAFKPSVFSALSRQSEDKDSPVALTTAVCGGFPGSGRRVIHSVVNAETDIACSCVVEYCQLTSPHGFRIGRGCILANCSYTSDGLVPFPTLSLNFNPLNSDNLSRYRCCNIPSDTFLHTIPVRFFERVQLVGTESKRTPSKLPAAADTCLDAADVSPDIRTGFVTLVYHTNDDLKTSGTIESLRWFGEPLNTVLKRIHRSKDDIFSSDTASGSLWHARLFPVMDTMEESFKIAVATANSQVSDGGWLSCGTEDRWWFSAAETVQCKDITSMVAYRTRLGETIRAALMNVDK